MIHQQNLSERMLVSYKFHENGRISFLKWAKFLGKVNAKKTVGFAVLSLRLTKIYKYHFLKMYRGIVVNQYHFILPEYKRPTESWPLHELKLIFYKYVPKKFGYCCYQQLISQI